MSNTTEPNMSPVIDLSSELLINRFAVREPYVRFLLSALGQEVAKGSPWIVLDKALAAAHDVLLPFIGTQPLQIAA
jgi:hypothetical protein